MDSILEDRLYALEQSLDRARNPSSWKDRLELHNVDVEERIWNWAIMDIRREVGRLVGELAAIRRDTHTSDDSSEGWVRYNEIHRASQELFGDCLELIGGLALRDKLIDAQISRLTDELIVSCAAGMYTNASPTIPAHLELPPRTLKRVVRMRFPEWTIWTLPLAVHEYGHIAIGEIPQLKDYCLVQAQEAVRLHAGDDGNATADPIRLERAIRCAEILMADAFATYTLGPAYACPALLLQFNPIPDESSAGSGLSDCHRAKFVLGVLEEMGKTRGADEANAFGAVLRKIRDRWDVVQKPDQNGKAAILDPVKVLNFFSEELSNIRPHVPYRTDVRDERLYGGWTVAKSWEAHWESQIRNHEAPLKIPGNVQPGSKLRDGLNAAWLCRLKAPAEMLSDIEIVATELCISIVSDRGTTKRQPGRRAAAPNANVKR